MATTRNLELGWYGLLFFRQLVPIYPVYAVMMIESGVTPLELSALFIVWSATVVALEVPLGAVADRVARKPLVVVSSVLKGVAFALWLAFPHFWGFLAGFVAWGLSGTLLSGTAEALLYEGLRQRGGEGRFAVVFARGAALRELGVATALLTGGVLSQGLGYTAALLVSATAPLLAAVVAATLLPAVEVPKEARGESYFTTLGTGWKYATGRPPVLYVLLLLGAVGTVYGVYEEYVGPFLRERDLGLAGIGLFMALYQGCRAAGMGLASRLWARDSKHLVGYYLVGAVCLLLMPLGGPLPMAVLLCAFVLLFAVAEITLETRLQHAIESHARATVTSVVNMGREILGMLYYLVIGLVATATSWSTMTHSLAAACLVLTLLIASVGRRWRT